jgi:hypothetical protein
LQGVFPSLSGSSISFSSQTSSPGGQVVQTGSVICVVLDEDVTVSIVIGGVGWVNGGGGRVVDPSSNPVGVVVDNVSGGIGRVVDPSSSPIGVVVGDVVDPSSSPIGVVVDDVVDPSSIPIGVVLGDVNGGVCRVVDPTSSPIGVVLDDDIPVSSGFHPSAGFVLLATMPQTSGRGDQ